VPETDPQPTSLYRHGVPILVGMLGLVPVLMLVIGLAARQWQIAAAAVPMGGFFGCAGRASWVRAQSRVALVAGDVTAARSLARRAALWGLAAFASIAVALLILNL
jgi:hypothetical protein